MRKEFIMRLATPREVAAAPFLETFKVRLDGALKNLI